MHICTRICVFMNIVCACVLVFFLLIQRSNWAFLNPHTHTHAYTRIESTCMYIFICTRVRMKTCMYIHKTDRSFLFSFYTHTLSDSDLDSLLSIFLIISRSFSNKLSSYYFMHATSDSDSDWSFLCFLIIAQLFNQALLCPVPPIKVWVTYTYIHTYTYTYIHSSSHQGTGTSIYIHTYVYIYIHIYIYT